MSDGERPGHARRRRILAAARRLVARRGYDGVTMRGLARASGVSVPTLYNRVGGKQALLSSAVEAWFAELLAGVEREAPGLERVLGVVELCRSAVLGEPAYARALVAAFGRPGGAQGLEASLVRGLARELAGGLAAMQREGHLVDWVAPPALAGRLAGHCVAATLAWSGGHLDDAAFAGSLRYGACLMLLGAARGGARPALERRARRAQGAAGAREPARRRGRK